MRQIVLAPLYWNYTHNQSGFSCPIIAGYVDASTHSYSIVRLGCVKLGHVGLG
jgi:hypothetical protein